MIGDGIGSLISTALPFIKSVAPKVLGTVGLSSIGALTSNAINKKMNKDNVINLSDKQVNDINKNLDIINKSKIFNKKITLGSGIFFNFTPNVGKYYYFSFN